MSSAPPKTELCAIDRQPPNAQVAIATLQDLFERRKDALAKIAATHLTAERLAKIAITCVSKSPKLLECTTESIVASVMAGAAMGLEAGGPLNQAYLIPRFNGRKKVMECTFLPSYRGLIDLARRSGHVLSIEADCVYEADGWELNKTEMGTTFSHQPSEEGDPGKVRLAYAVARLKDSPVPIVTVMFRRDIDAVRNRERKQAQSPWDTDFAEMSKKSCIRRISKYLPMSIEMANGLDAEAENEEHDVVPTQTKRLRAVASPEGKSEDAISGPSEPSIDTSESQEQLEAENIAGVLRGIELLRTGDECTAHAERLNAMRWNSDADRKAAASAFKGRWKAILDEAKAAMKAATTATAPVSAPLTAAAGTPIVLTRCEECGLLKGHATGCPNEDANVDTKTIDWVKEKVGDPAPMATGTKAPPASGVRVKLSDGSYMDPGTGEVDGDEIQGRDRIPGEDDD